MLKSVFDISVEDDSAESVIYVAKEGSVIGKINYNRIDKVNVKGEIKELTDDIGMTSSLLSADKVSVVNAMKEKLGLDKAIAGASPKYKADYVKNRTRCTSATASTTRKRSNCLTAYAYRQEAIKYIKTD